MAKQLGDFLQEQQEPFTLELYLHDKGYSSSSQFLKDPTVSSQKKRRKSLERCSKIARAMFRRLVRSEANRKTKKIDDRHQDSAEDDHFSSASSTTVFNSCSESDAEDENKQVLEDRKMRFNSVDDDEKQLSPVSVLQETESSDDDCFPIHHQNNLMSSTEQENQQARKEQKTSADSQQYTRNRYAIQQTKQLMFDCVSEVVESNRRKDNSSTGTIFDPEQLWKLICDKIWEWSQDTIDETNINQLIRFDLSDPAPEWQGFHGVQAREIGVVISEIMLDEIREDIVNDMV